MSSLPSLPLEPGRLLGRFELLLPIARGGMAQVWAARPPSARGFRKIVAIKTLHCGASDMRLEDMLLEEAKLASLIVHPNVVATHELGEEEGLLYLVMEWVDGLPLSELIKANSGGSLPLSVAVQLLAQVCKGLHAAHELRDDKNRPLGLVHRDISPQNILVDRRGLAKVLDFGVAKATERDSGLTADGELKGKIAYMSPEQISGKKVDRRTDIFALCTLFYLVTTGHHPFRGQTVAETVRNVGSDKRPTAPSKVVSGYPKPLEEILMKGLAFEPTQRWSTAHELLVALEKAFPQYTQGFGEKTVAEYLEQMLGGALKERRDRLDRAQDEMDLCGPRSGTMRAITLASLAENELSASLSSRMLELEAFDAPDLQRRFPIKPVVIGIGALCAVVVAQLAFLQSGSFRSVAERPVPEAATNVPDPEAVTETEPAVATSDAARDDEVLPEPAKEPEVEAQVDSSRKPTATAPSPKRVPRWRAPTWTSQRPAKTPAVEEPASEQPQVPAPAPQPIPRNKPVEPDLDAWNPADFGDRH